MQTRPVHSEVMQTRQLALPRPRRARITSALSRLSDLPPSTLTTPPVSLPPIFSTLARVDPNSEEFLPILGLFIQNKGEHKLLARLKGSAAVYVADILDKLLDVLPTSHPQKHFKYILHLLRSLCGSWGVLPTSYTIQQEVPSLSQHPWTRSNSSEVFKEISGGETVTVKVLRVRSSNDPGRLNKGSHHLETLETPERPPILRSFLPWHATMFSFPMDGERQHRAFVTKNPHINRFKLLVDVCTALQYLHDQDIVHGDLKGDNVLIDEGHSARLSDFGLANFDRSRWLGVTSNSSDPGGTTPYMAPELFPREPKGCQLRGSLMRKEADVYALGMLIYEVLTGNRPFYNVRQETIRHRVIRGERPRRHSSMLIPDQLWEIVQACWSKDPTQRPTVGDVLMVCAAQASQNVPAVWPLRNLFNCSRAKHPSKAIETDSSAALWCSSPVSG